MDFVVNLQNPSACFSMSAFSPLQKLTLTFVASGALKRIWTRELLSTCGNWASRTLDEAGLKSLGPWAKQKLALNNNKIAMVRIMHLWDLGKVFTTLQLGKLKHRNRIPAHLLNKAIF
jgi:hypothetical protein